jgi:hypothetical protein
MTIELKELPLLTTPWTLQLKKMNEKKNGRHKLPKKRRQKTSAKKNLPKSKNRNNRLPSKKQKKQQPRPSVRATVY